ncbi:type 4a pilus biogenesis protein PilO [Undibacterium sp. RTI2.1]|uniref:type 4a pilus biogenesis protein PilO n=1 Tax=unclassified Undibacterium TaxID=2630295 RepID=UPI002AB3F4E3|nr:MULTISPECIES: type 4a pilus biogenesis protein PilO [unclassified Undibacterium]MDY7539248.1 type 4a pilus biogenesis protein PilO [Undibacterium sp. 5I1]MEB0031462.1 type 4a pilus biogenesis protein PilO [Undibacterium sp. RTI2.1]MEB0116210.1 type 4a pilus biogenesis protein PilO [Undibacterium sp. RTI2.2]MEB0231734.1 type 4a pilus biogenesis protein PilO [Undibacterium sp. 10I3]MEB0256952.1 type 4a pilus biogenesis protein PilO [Undibacterium sp. 5I1]
MANFNELSELANSQFRDLNGLHPGLWPFIPRVLLALGLVIFLIFVGWFGYWDGQLEDLDKGQQEEQKLKDAYKQKIQQSISLEALKEQRKLVLQYVAAMEKQLPSKAEMDALVSDINQAAIGKGLQIDVFKPGQPTVKDYYAELPIDIKLLGNYHEMGEFVSDIAKLPRIITLNNLAISTGKDNVLVLDVVAKTFRYLDPEEVSNQAALKKGAKK